VARGRPRVARGGGVLPLAVLDRNLRSQVQQATGPGSDGNGKYTAIHLNAHLLAADFYEASASAEAAVAGFPWTAACQE